MGSNEKNPLIVNDEDALIHGQKFTRQTTDGKNTTIVFYSFNENPHPTKMKFRDDMDVEGFIATAADDRLKNFYRDAAGQVEAIGNGSIKFYDIDKLTDKEKISLEQWGITIPSTPDVIVTYSDHFGYAGIAEFPRKNDNEKPGIYSISKVYSSYPDEKLFEIILHEFGHSIGLKHPHDVTPLNNRILDPNLRNRSFTMMSWLETGLTTDCPAELYHKYYRTMDIKGIECLYPPQTVNKYYRQLSQDEDERIKKELVDCEGYGKKLGDFAQLRKEKLSDLIKDSVFDVKDLENLGNYISDLKKIMFNEREQNYLKQNPGADEIRFIEYIKPIKSEDFTMDLNGEEKIETSIRDTNVEGQNCKIDIKGLQDIKYQKLLEEKGQLIVTYNINNKKFNIHEL